MTENKTRQKPSAKFPKGIWHLWKNGTQGDCFLFSSPNIHPCSQR